ncbi:DNA translocase FtsK [Nocardia sp. NPDC004711]
MSATTITVGTADLRQALASVRVHASTDKDFPEINRVRLTIGTEHMTVSATDRFTAALADVSVWEHDGEPVELVELLRDDVAELLSIFHAPGKDSGDSPQYLLRFEIDAEQVTAKDCSGLNIGVGREYSFPRLATEDALNVVPRLIEHAHSGQLVTVVDLGDMTISGDHLSRWKDATKAYGERLAVETRRGLMKRTQTMLMRCGESFLGAMVPQSMFDEERDKARAYAERWSARLPQIVAATPPERVPQADPADPAVSASTPDNLGDDRDLYVRAVELVVRSQFGSGSMLQRKLRIGYGKAGRLLDQMEQAGIVGPTKVSGGRDVHVAADQADALLADLRNVEVSADA